MAFWLAGPGQVWPVVPLLVRVCGFVCAFFKSSTFPLFELGDLYKILMRGLCVQLFACTVLHNSPCHSASCAESPGSLAVLREEKQSRFCARSWWEACVCSCLPAQYHLPACPLCRVYGEPLLSWERNNNPGCCLKPVLQAQLEPTSTRRSESFLAHVCPKSSLGPQPMGPIKSQ